MTTTTTLTGSPARGDDGPLQARPRSSLDTALAEWDALDFAPRDLLVAGTWCASASGTPVAGRGPLHGRDDLRGRGCGAGRCPCGPRRGVRRRRGVVARRPTGDAHLRVEGGRALAAGVPGARLVEHAGVDHIPWFGDSGAILGEIEEFLTGARHQSAPERVLATVLFVHIVASTEHAVNLGDSVWRRLLDRFDEITRREVGRFRGHEINRRGDDFLATFDGPARAAQCALAISTALRPLGIEMRAGVHTGEIELRDDDVVGIAVHIGARVCSLAAANEVLTTRTVRDLTVGSDLRFSDRGDHALKGVPEPVQIYRVEG